jgi:hypothetical protein
MEKPRAIKLCFLRQDGRREWKELEHCTLSEARVLVCGALQSAGGVYTEAEICIEDAYTEMIPKAAASVELESA